MVDESSGHLIGRWGFTTFVNPADCVVGTVLGGCLCPSTPPYPEDRDVSSVESLVGPSGGTVRPMSPPESVVKDRSSSFVSGVRDGGWIFDHWSIQRIREILDRKGRYSEDTSTSLYRLQSVTGADRVPSSSHFESTWSI